MVQLVPGRGEALPKYCCRLVELYMHRSLFRFRGRPFIDNGNIQLFDRDLVRAIPVARISRPAGLKRGFKGHLCGSCIQQLSSVGFRTACGNL